MSRLVRTPYVRLLALALWVVPLLNTEAGLALADGNTKAPTKTRPAHLLPIGQSLAGSILFGSWVKPRSTDPVVTANSGEDAVLNMESQIGRALSLDHVYYHFDDQWPTDRQVWDVENGRVPMINWMPEEPTMTWAGIASGQADSIIDARAEAAKAFGSPIFLAFHHEPENDTTVYGSPAEYVAAWRHVRARFDAVGATNVKFVMILMAQTYRTANMNLWYPGSTVIDYVAADGYNWYGAHAGAVWRDVSTIFQPFYNWSIRVGKPAMITETGCLEDPTDPLHKAEWFMKAGQWLQASPNIKGFMYFSSDRLWPWWADSSEPSLAGYANLARQPAFS